MIQRGGDVVIRMLENVKQKTILPLIQSTIASGTLVYTDEYDIYNRLPDWATSTRRSVTATANMHGTRMAMDSMRCM